MPSVDRIAGRLTHEVGPERPASDAMALEQRALVATVAWIGQGAVDLEMVSPARQLQTVEAPRARALRKKVKRKVSPLASEESDLPGHADAVYTPRVEVCTAQR